MVVATATQKDLSLAIFWAMLETKPASKFIDGEISDKFERYLDLVIEIRFTAG